MRKLVARLEAENADVACTLPAARDLTQRRAEFGEVAARALMGIDRRDREMTARFRGGLDVEAALVGLVEREHACCSFATYELARDDDTLRLDLSVPAEGEVFLDEIEAALRGDGDPSVCC